MCTELVRGKADWPRVPGQEPYNGTMKISNAASIAELLLSIEAERLVWDLSRGYRAWRNGHNSAWAVLPSLGGTRPRSIGAVSNEAVVELVTSGLVELFGVFPQQECGLTEHGERFCERKSRGSMD